MPLSGKEKKCNAFLFKSFPASAEWWNHLMKLTDKLLLKAGVASMHGIANALKLKYLVFWNVCYVTQMTSKEAEWDDIVAQLW